MIFATNLVNSSATRATCRFLPSEISFHVLSYPYRSIVDLYTAFNFHFNVYRSTLLSTQGRSRASPRLSTPSWWPRTTSTSIFTPTSLTTVRWENIKCQLYLTNNHHYFVAGKGCISFPWQGKQRSGPISNDFMRQY